MKIQKWQGGKKNFWVKLAHQLQTAPSNGETTLANTDAIRNVIIEKAREDAVAKGEDPNRAEEDILRRTGTVAAAFPLALGIAGAGTAVATNPALYGKAAFETATSMAGGAGVDAASEAITGKSFGENVAHYTGADKAYQNNALTRFGFDMLNPGYALGGGVGKTILGRAYPTVFNPNVGRFTGPPSKESYSSPTATVRNNAPEPTRPITEAERAGIPRGERSNLSEDQLQAIDDLLWYKQNGRYKTNFYFNETTDKFRWGTPASKQDAEVGAVKALIDHGAKPKGVNGPIRLSTKEGNFAIWPGKNAAYTSNFPIPEGMKRGPGETSLILEDNAGHEMKTILTSPRVDLANSMEDASKELLESLPNTIDKNIMKRFWSNNEEMIKPGTYLSGDNKKAPLGSYAIRAFDKNKSFNEGLFEILYPEHTIVERTGLSPDSYSSIIRQAQRGNKKLRWGQGYTRWNDSAIENAQIYKDWKRMNAGEITPEEYKEIFDAWAVPLGGRPLEIKVSSPFSLVKNNDGTFSKVAQPQKKMVIIPHPYIMYRKQGGILKAQNGTFESFWNTLPSNQKDSSDFNIRRYWELNGKPQTFEEAVAKGMYSLEKDNLWHAGSIAYNENTGEYEFMKSPNHPTIQYEIDAYNSDDMKGFRKRFYLDSTSIPWKYKPRKEQGGVLKAQDGQTTPEPNFKDRILKPIKDFAEQRRVEKPKDTLNTQPQISETPKFPNNQRARFGAPPGPHFTALMGHKPHSIECGGKI